jgi:hypothetical protein
MTGGARSVGLHTEWPAKGDATKYHRLYKIILVFTAISSSLAAARSKYLIRRNNGGFRFICARDS